MLREEQASDVQGKQKAEMRECGGGLSAGLLSALCQERVVSWDD